MIKKKISVRKKRYKKDCCSKKKDRDVSTPQEHAEVHVGQHAEVHVGPARRSAHGTA